MNAGFHAPPLCTATALGCAGVLGLRSIFRSGVMRGSIFILIVDDDIAFAEAAARTFESVGMRTLLVLGWMSGTGIFDWNAVDVIITDIDLATREPRASALARMLSTKRPQTSIILLTAHPEVLKEDVETSSAGPSNAFEIAELCRAIRVRHAQ